MSEMSKCLRLPQHAFCMYRNWWRIWLFKRCRNFFYFLHFRGQKVRSGALIPDTDQDPEHLCKKGSEPESDLAKKFRIRNHDTAIKTVLFHFLRCLEMRDFMQIKKISLPKIRIIILNLTTNFFTTRGSKDRNIQLSDHYTLIYF